MCVFTLEILIICYFLLCQVFYMSYCWLYRINANIENCFFLYLTPLITIIPHKKTAHSVTFLCLNKKNSWMRIVCSLHIFMSNINSQSKYLFWQISESFQKSRKKPDLFFVISAMINIGYLVTIMSRSDSVPKFDQLDAFSRSVRFRKSHRLIQFSCSH